jgi:hypothetical protein
MNISSEYPSWRSIQRMHLWRRLQQRMAAAQDNPTLLALLAQEAHDLQLKDIHHRRQRTIAALQHLRVSHESD